MYIPIPSLFITPAGGRMGKLYKPALISEKVDFDKMMEHFIRDLSASWRMLLSG